MQELAIDIETFSSNDLIKGGVYKYVEAPDFEILLFAYKLNNEPVQIVDMFDLFNYKFYEFASTRNLLYSWLINPEVLKTAFNANFERTCIAKYFGITLPPEQWECSSVKGSMLGLPLSLDKAAEALNLKQQKSFEGKALIRYFSIPCKPTKANGERTRNLPEHAPDKWQKFKDYCVQDVVVEQEIRKAISFFKIPDQEKKLWYLDQKINDNGILLDKPFIENAIRFDETYNQHLIKEAVDLTGLQNPKSVQQLKKWLEDESGEEIENLNKDNVPALLASAKTETIKRVLEIRQETSMTSIKKYRSMLNCICTDGRGRGFLQFYGANRTGRWCLAENSKILVKNKKGKIFEKNIQDVLLTDLVFDGDEWVKHEGVVFSGKKQTIMHDNICATPEHIVYLDTNTRLSLKEAKEKKLQLWKGNTEFIKSQVPQIKAISD